MHHFHDQLQQHNIVRTMRESLMPISPAHIRSSDRLLLFEVHKSSFFFVLEKQQL